MADYLGTEIQTRLQQRSDENAEWARSTPGAYISGRMLGSDDIDALGWDTIHHALTIDGAFGFRMIPADRVRSVEERLAGSGYRVDWWDTFLGGAVPTLAICDDIAARGPSEGLAMISSSAGIFPARQIQELLLGSGMAPFSGPMLCGEVCPSVTLALTDMDGSPQAAGHAYLPHNKHSPYHRYAWAGLIAVAESQRGKGLGRLINALVIRAAFRELGADNVYENVSATNATSRRMIEGCGLVFDPSVRTGVATSAGERFSR